MAKDQNPVCSLKTSDIDAGSQDKIKIPMLTANHLAVKAHVKTTLIVDLPKFGTMIILNPAVRSLFRRIFNG